MLSPTTHPFIFNTLVSSGKWSLDVSHFKSASLWAVSTVFDDDKCHENTTVATGSTAQEALDRLEDALSGRGAILSGREYVANKTDPEREAYLARWKDAPEWAEWLSQDFDGRCHFFESHPEQDDSGEWWASDANAKDWHFDRRTLDNLLGSVRCEPRPTL